MRRACTTIAWLVAIACVSVPVASQVDRSRGGSVTAENFEARYALNSAVPANLEFVQDPAGSARIVVRARVRDTDSIVAGGSRTEISPLKEYVREGVRWYAMSVYFPAEWQFHPSPTVVSQLHTSQKSTVVSPPVSFVAHDRNLYLELHFNHRRIDGDDPVTKENSARQRIRLDSIRPEQWYCFVVRADWSFQPGKGALWIWLNGDKVYEAVNSHNAYESWLGNWPKTGLYLPGKMAVPERTLYADFIHVGGAKSTIATMSGLTPCAKAKGPK
jgi:hypothetical protein